MAASLQNSKSTRTLTKIKKTKAIEAVAHMLSEQQDGKVFFCMQMVIVKG